MIDQIGTGDTSAQEDGADFLRFSHGETTRLLTQPVRVLETGVYRGPHHYSHNYSHTPMVRIMLDLGGALGARV